LKVYLSAPMIANRALDRAKLMAKAIEDSGNEMTSPWVIGPIEMTDSPVDVFQRDKRGAEECDILVADVSDPSIGVGMEIMAAYKSGRRLILVAKKGNVISRMLQHMDRKQVLQYEKEEELYPMLKDVLTSLRS
jgi:2'-deoxynucleoside 5'-phosphate N-hydrolase